MLDALPGFTGVNMPLLSILRLIFTILSLLILGAAIYMLWEWYDGDLIRQADGDLVRVRQDWLLWTALAVLAFSFLGKFLLAPLLARPDHGDPSKPERRDGTTITGGSGASLYVEQSGPANAPVLVLTHGWAMDSTIWYYTRRALEQHFRIIVWDLAGLGKSKPARADAIGLTENALDLTSVIELAGGKRVILVGHSIGGMTIQTLARDNPEFFRSRVSGAVLVDTTYTNPLKTMILSGLAQAIRWPIIEPVMRLVILLQPLAWLSAWQSYLSGMSHLANQFGFGKYVTRSQLEHTTLLATRNPPGNISRGNLAMIRWDATGALAKSGVPVLLIAGDMDIVTKPEASAQIAAMTPGARVETVEGVNHMGFLEKSSDYVALITRFAQDHAPAAI